MRRSDKNEHERDSSDPWSFRIAVAFVLGVIAVIFLSEPTIRAAAATGLQAIGEWGTGIADAAAQALTGDD